MKKENNNVVVVPCPPCGENALEGQKGVLTRAVVGRVLGVRVDNVRTTRLRTCNPLGTARSWFVVGQALPDNAPTTGHLSFHVILNSFQDLHRSFFKRAFTLIELLVVILIIGILAAVVVPQYQKAILKSRATQGFAHISAIDKAQKSYYLANGSFSSKINKLDIDITMDICSITDSIVYCQVQLSPGFSFEWGGNNDTGRTRWVCFAKDSNKIANKICAEYYNSWEKGNSYKTGVLHYYNSVWK